METWEYRVLGLVRVSSLDPANRVPYIAASNIFDAEDDALGQHAVAMATMLAAAEPHNAPFTIERRLVGVWQPVETKDTDA